MKNAAQTNAPQAGRAAPKRPRAGNRRALIWLRYNWWKALLHALLIYMGLTNLYPFFWMVGTSFKAEAEASSERLSPLPAPKFQLPRGFRLDAVVPAAMEPALAQAGDAKARRAAMERLHRSLVLVDKMQRDARPENVTRCVAESLAAEGHPAYAAAQKDAAAKEKAARDLEKARGERGARDQVQEARLAEARRAADAALAARAAVVSAELDLLVRAGFLAKAGGECWPGPRLRDAGGDDGLQDADRRVAGRLRAHFAATAKDVSRLTKTGMEDAEAMLKTLAGIGLLAEAGRSPEGETRYRLEDGARGAVTAEGLYPRQILTLWAMADENRRRSEGRATFALDSWSAKDYASAHGMSDLAAAARELADLSARGHLRDATVQAINYWVVLKGENFLLHTLTTVIITAFCVVGTVCLSSMLGYALVRLRFPGKLLVLGIMIGSSILPGEARIIPIFQMLMSVGAMQNLWGMTLWLTSFGVGNALLMAGFFLTLPKEVDEAAQVDGAGVFRTFFDIALPMARPVVMTVGLFAFLNAWNNFMIPLLCTLSRPSMQPLAVAVYTFQQGHPGKWHEINAAAAVMTLPVILLFLCVQKHVVKSIAIGAVKG